jgi:hypothetical protein
MGLSTLIVVPFIFYNVNIYYMFFIGSRAIKSFIAVVVSSFPKASKSSKHSTFVCDLNCL